MEWRYDQQQSSTENGNKNATYTYQQKERVEISRTLNEVRGLWKLNTHKTYWKQEEQKKRRHNLANENV